MPNAYPPALIIVHVQSPSCGAPRDALKAFRTMPRACTMSSAGGGERWRSAEAVDGGHRSHRWRRAPFRPWRCKSIATPLGCQLGILQRSAHDGGGGEFGLRRGSTVGGACHSSTRRRCASCVPCCRLSFASTHHVSDAMDTLAGRRHCMMLSLLRRRLRRRQSLRRMPIITTTAPRIARAELRTSLPLPPIVCAMQWIRLNDGA